MVSFCNGKVTVFQSRIYCTNSTIVEFEDSVIICDPSWFPDEIDSIRNFVERNYFDKKQFLFITHFDYDHVWGWKAFADAEIIAPDWSYASQLKNKCLKEWADWDEAHYVKRSYQPRFPDKIHYQLTEPTSIRLGSMKINFVPVPGHTIDSFAAYVPDYGLLLAGDYLSDVEIPWISSGVSEYEQSLDYLKNIIEQLNPLLVIPGHGNARSDRAELLQNLEQAKWYLDNFNSIDEEIIKSIENYINSFPFSGSSRKIHIENLEVNNR